jgi:hypothetical protein
MGFLAILCSVRVQQERTLRDGVESPRMTCMSHLRNLPPTFAKEKENMKKMERNKMQPRPDEVPQPF